MNGARPEGWAAWPGAGQRLLDGIFHVVLKLPPLPPRHPAGTAVTGRLENLEPALKAPAMSDAFANPCGTWRPCLAGLAVLALVTPAAAQASAEETLDLRIEPGDTLIGLHARLMHPQADWRVVQRLNRIADPRRLQPGRTLRIPLSLLREEAVSAEVLHSHGDVFVEHPGGAREPLAAAALLRAGDVVTTGAQSSASLRFADGSRALLGPGSRLRVERHVQRAARGGFDTQLQLDRGAVETRVQPAKPSPRFELRTPVANLGVRGTDFRARLDGERVLAEVLQGRVAVGATALDAGFGTVATPAGVAPPQPLPAAPDLSGLPALVERLPLQFGLPAMAGAARYRVQVFDVAGGGVLVLDGLFDKPQAAWPDSPPDGRYELRAHRRRQRRRGPHGKPALRAEGAAGGTVPAQAACRRNAAHAQRGLRLVGPPRGHALPPAGGGAARLRRAAARPQRHHRHQLQRCAARGHLALAAGHGARRQRQRPLG